MGMEDRHELISNARQSHAFFACLSTRVRTLMRKSQVYCFARERLILNLEKFATQGLPLFLPPDSEHAQLLSLPLPCLESLDAQVLDPIAGNGMVLRVVGSALAFIWLH